MRELHDLEPAIGTSLLGCHDVTDTLHEDFAAAAGNRIEARGLELADHVARVHAEARREEVDFARREAVNVNRMMLLDIAHQIQIPLERDIRIVPALNQDLHATKRLCLLDLIADLFEGEGIPFPVFRTTVEGAESTVRYTDVRVVDIAVDDISDNAVGMLRLTHAIGFHAEFEQRSIRIEIEKVTHR